MNGGWAKIGGTSMAAPLWGALAALADQGQPATVGFMNPALYQAQCAGDDVFNDVTTGDNEPDWFGPERPAPCAVGALLPRHAGLRPRHRARDPDRRRAGGDAAIAARRRVPLGARRVGVVGARRRRHGGDVDGLEPLCGQRGRLRSRQPGGDPVGRLQLGVGGLAPVPDAAVGRRPTSS